MTFWSDNQDQVPDYQLGTFRSTSPIRTLRRLKPLLSSAGITRLARVTDLDTIGIPVYQAIRPNSRNMSVSQGKGLTRAQARVSALMESLEGFHAEEIRATSMRASCQEVAEQIHYDVKDLATSRMWPAAMSSSSRRADGQTAADAPRLDWVEATNLETGRQSWVPRQLCELDFTVKESISLSPFSATSNGLASGNSAIEALIHGLCEVVERDSYLTNESFRHDPERNVRLDTVSSPFVRSVLRKLDRVDFVTSVTDVTGPTGLPAFEALISEPDRPVFQGFGCHPNRDTSLIRALTEAVQSRLTYIAGSRDDVYRETFQRLDMPHGSGLSLDEFDQAAIKPQRHYEDCAEVEFPNWNHALTGIVRRIREQTGTAPLAVDLTRVEFGIPIVFVVAPGLRAPSSSKFE